MFVSMLHEDTLNWTVREGIVSGTYIISADLYVTSVYRTRTYVTIENKAGL